MKCPPCGREWEAVPSTATAPAPTAGEEWLFGVPNGDSDAQVKHFKDLGYEMLGRAVADSHKGERYDGRGHVAFLGDGPKRHVAFLYAYGIGHWYVHLRHWDDSAWPKFWRFSVRKKRPAW